MRSHVRLTTLGHTPVQPTVTERFRRPVPPLGPLYHVLAARQAI